MEHESKEEQDVIAQGSPDSQILRSFSEALHEVKCGLPIQRTGWNGKGLKVKAQFPDENSKMTFPYLYIEYPDGKRCPWLASQTDIMAEDWVVLIPEPVLKDNLSL